MDATRVPRAGAARRLPGWSGVLLFMVLGATAGVWSGPLPSARGAAAAATPSLALSPASGQAGVSVTATGAGFSCPNVRVPTADLSWDQKQSLGTASVSGGGFSLTFQVPAGAAAGSHTVTATCSTVSASATFTVVQPAPSPTPSPTRSAPTVTATPQGGGQGSSAAPTQTAVPGTTPGTEVSPTEGSPLPGGTPSGTAPATPAAGDAASSAAGTAARAGGAAGPTGDGAPGSGAAGRRNGGSGSGAGDSSGRGRSAPAGDGQADGASNLRSAYARALPTPGQVFRHPARVGSAAGLALLLLPLVGFAAELFHKTVHHNRATLRRWFAWASPLPVSAGRIPRPLLMPGFFLLSAVLAVLVEPGVGADAATVALLLGFLVAIPLGILLYNKSMDAYERRISGGEPGELEVLPGAAVVAIGCALLSWGAAFNPGYVYGLIAEYRARGGRALPRRSEGRAVLLGALVMLAAASVAWVVRVPLLSVLAHHRSGPGAFALAVVENVLCQVVVGAVVAAPIVLLPIHYMDGRKLWEWNRLVWAAVCGVALLFFTVLVLDPSGMLGTAGWQAWLRAVWLFGGFAVFSVLFWAFFQVVPAGLLAGEGRPDDPDLADTTPIAFRRGTSASSSAGSSASTVVFTKADGGWADGG